MILKIIEILVFVLIFSGLMWLLYKVFHTEWSFNKPLSEDDIKSFDEEGYIYNNSLSGTNEIVFTRR